MDLKVTKKEIAERLRIVAYRIERGEETGAEPGFIWNLFSDGFVEIKLTEKNRYE